VIKSVVKDGAEKEANEIIRGIHHSEVQNHLILDENKGLRESLYTKKKRNKHGKRMDFERNNNNTSGAEWWSLRSFKRAGERQVQREQAEEEKKLRKADMKELKASNTLFKKKLQEERRIERESMRKEREREKEKKAQELAQKKQQKEKEKQAVQTRKIARLSQITPATTLKKQVPKRKRVERCTGGASGVDGEESPPAPPPKVTRTGRSITVPRKFR
jgi:hypothetical protein